jgi:hypothetical protein
VDKEGIVDTHKVEAAIEGVVERELWTHSKVEAASLVCVHGPRPRTPPAL